MKLEYDRQEILDVIDRIVRRTMKMDLTWEWPCGVAYYGIADAYEKTGNEEYLTLLKDRVDELIDLGLPPVWTVNACAMGHCLLSLYKATGEQKYWDIVMSKSAISGRRRCALATECCSIPCRQTMTSRSNVGRIPCLWRHFSCCGQG